MSDQRRFAIRTYGCQMNVHDTEKIANLLHHAGLAAASGEGDADLLVMLGEIEGLFTADPHIDPNARLISTVERLDEETESRGGPSSGDYGRGGMATKLEAARLATSSGVDVVIAGGTQPDVLVRLANGESIGTAFPATTTKMESRKRWMLSGLSTRGEILVDDGAARALRDQAMSLLPAGVTGV